MANPTPRSHDGNVIDLFSGRPHGHPENQRIIRLSPEHDGLCMLYSSGNRSNKLYSMRILCWALRDNGDVVGLVPWLNKIAPCPELGDHNTGFWEGYYDPVSHQVFYEAPLHKLLELENASRYFASSSACNDDQVLQEIPDTIGTHAMLDSDDQRSLILTEVLSWRLLGDGSMHAMLIDDDKIAVTPVLPGDPCLYPADSNPNFRYFFQHHIANQIKAEDPEALAAIALLFDG